MEPFIVVNFPGFLNYEGNYNENRKKPPQPPVALTMFIMLLEKVLHLNTGAGCLVEKLKKKLII